LCVAEIKGSYTVTHFSNNNNHHLFISSLYLLSNNCANFWNYTTGKNRHVSTTMELTLIPKIRNVAKILFEIKNCKKVKII
jgi:hypothetical protein